MIAIPTSTLASRKAAEAVILEALNASAQRRGDLSQQTTIARDVVNALDSAGFYLPEPDATSG